MRLAAYSLVLLVACNNGGEGDDYYVEPGGGGGTFGNQGGALPDAGGATDGGATIEGRVCGMTSLLRWDDCETIGLDGLLVKVGTSTATALGDGAFEIQSPSGSNLAWRVSGNDQLASLREYPGDLQIPSVTADLYEETALDAGVVPNDNAGTVFAQVIYAGAPVVGATAMLAGSIDIVYYDDAAGAADFSVGQTRADGIVWFPNVTAGTAVMFTITPPAIAGCTCTPQNVRVVVEPNTATFATVAFL